MEREYPYEHRYLTYADNLARVAGLPAASAEPLGERWNNDVMFRSNSPAVGCMPYGKIDSLDRKRLSRQLLLANWSVFSRELRASHGLGGTVNAYYAEKTPPMVAERVSAAMTVRHLFLIRDPRDELVSIRSFNHKRGFNGFGWLDSDTDASYARKMCRNRKQFLNDMITLRQDRQTFKVRYEDLILRGDLEVTRLGSWLGLSLDRDAASSDQDIRQQHMTSTSAVCSVGRWREELSEEAQRIFRSELSDELKALGYSVGA